MGTSAESRKHLEAMLAESGELQRTIDALQDEKRQLVSENVSMRKELEGLEVFRPLVNIANGGGFDVSITDRTAMTKLLGVAAKVYGTHAVAGMTSKDEAMVKKARLHVSVVAEACILYALKNNTAEVIRGYLGKPNTL